MEFYEKTHTYVKNNYTYKSVTSILKDLEPKKDWDKIAKAYALKNNLSLEEVKRKWKHEKDISIDRGSKYHIREESALLELPSALVKESEDIEDYYSVPIFAPTFVDGVKKSNNMVLTDGVYPELMLWLDSAKIAGQADKVEVINNTLNIIDYKTNKKIDLASWKNKFGKGEKLLYPVSHLDNCNFNIYSLQLNMYAYIIKRHNPSFRIGKIIIKHIQFNDKGDSTGFIEYKVPLLQKEVINIISSIK